MGTACTGQLEIQHVVVYCNGCFASLVHVIYLRISGTSGCLGIVLTFSGDRATNRDDDVAKQELYG
jgi:hypothetical protein